MREEGPISEEGDSPRAIRLYLFRAEANRVLASTAMLPIDRLRYAQAPQAGIPRTLSRYCGRQRVGPVGQ